MPDKPQHTTDTTNKNTVPERPARQTTSGAQHRSGRAAQKPHRQTKPAAPPPIIPEREPTPNHLIIGRIAGAHGLRGECRMVLITNHPEALRTLKTCYLGEEQTAYSIRRIHLLPGGKEAIIRFFEISAPEAAADLKGQRVWVEREALPPLPEGELYHYQLLGLDVQKEDGTPLGRLAEIIETGANDVYVVRGVTGEVLLPAIEQVIVQIDLDAGVMTVRPQEYY